MKIATRQDIRRASGRLIACGFDGTVVTSELREILREVAPAGLVIFARNVENPEQISELNRELKLLRRGEPVLLCVDQEGGRVARIKHPATEWPSMRRLGELGDVALVQRVGAALARELRAMNFDVDFAPVLDVDTNPDNPVIGDRAFSRDPEVVAELGAAFIAGMQGGGVAACGKHFPGHGDTALDSHLALPRVSHVLSRLQQIEWPPFVAGVKAGLGAIMTAHVVVEALDPDLPATLSRAALTPLREHLGFRGVVISDDLEMKAVADHYSITKMATLGLNAGVDLFLACHKPDVILGLYRAIIHAVERDEVSHEALLAAERRVVAWRETYARPPMPKDAWRNNVGCSAHQELAGEIAARLAHT